MSGFKNNIIYCYPPKSKKNQYIHCHYRIWEQAGFEVEPAPVYLRGAIKALSPRRKPYLVLNWYEDEISYSKSPVFDFFRFTAMLFVFRLAFKKIVWVKHNFCGHDNGRSDLRRCMEWMLRFFSVRQVAHRPLNGFTYIPHPLYPKDDSLEAERSIPFLYFGVVKKYKGLDKLLNAWPENQTLVMVGAAPNQDLKRALLKIIEQRGLQVEWRDEFIETQELDQLLSRAKFVIIPHVENSMIVSGAAYHAFTYGAQVLVRQSDFAEYLEKTVKSVKVFSLEGLPEQLNTLSKESTALDTQSVESEFGDKHLVRLWSEVFGA